MGAEVFVHTVGGASARDAFERAVKSASYAYGHAGYTGTIAEKDDYIMIEMPSGFEGGAERYASVLINQCDERIDDKWGPAGCIDHGDGNYTFFGWASA